MLETTCISTDSLRWQRLRLVVVVVAVTVLLLLALHPICSLMWLSPKLSKTET